LSSSSAIPSGKTRVGGLSHGPGGGHVVNLPLPGKNAVKVNKLVSYRYHEWVFYKVGQNTNKIISAEKSLFLIEKFFYGKNKG
jgi:hypothetical protein